MANPVIYGKLSCHMLFLWHQLFLSCHCTASCHSSPQVTKIVLDGLPGYLLFVSSENMASCNALMGCFRCVCLLSCSLGQPVNIIFAYLVSYYIMLSYTKSIYRMSVHMKNVQSSFLLDKSRNADAIEYIFFCKWCVYRMRLVPSCLGNHHRTQMVQSWNTQSTWQWGTHHK